MNRVEQIAFVTQQIQQYTTQLLMWFVPFGFEISIIVFYDTFVTLGKPWLNLIHSVSYYRRYVNFNITLLL